MASVDNLCRAIATAILLQNLLFLWATTADHGKVLQSEIRLHSERWQSVTSETLPRYSGPKRVNVRKMTQRINVLEVKSGDVTRRYGGKKRRMVNFGMFKVTVKMIVTARKINVAMVTNTRRRKHHPRFVGCGWCKKLTTSPYMSFVTSIKCNATWTVYEEVITSATVIKCVTSPEVTKCVKTTSCDCSTKFSTKCETSTVCSTSTIVTVPSTTRITIRCETSSIPTETTTTEPETTTPTCVMSSSPTETTTTIPTTFTTTLKCVTSDYPIDIITFPTSMLTTPKCENTDSSSATVRCVTSTFLTSFSTVKCSTASIIIDETTPFPKCVPSELPTVEEIPTPPPCRHTYYRPTFNWTEIYTRTPCFTVAMGATATKRICTSPEYVHSTPCQTSPCVCENITTPISVTYPPCGSKKTCKVKTPCYVPSTCVYTTPPSTTTTPKITVTIPTTTTTHYVTKSCPWKTCHYTRRTCYCMARVTAIHNHQYTQIIGTATCPHRPGTCISSLTTPPSTVTTTTFVTTNCKTTTTHPVTCVTHTSRGTTTFYTTFRHHSTYKCQHNRPLGGIIKYTYTCINIQQYSTTERCATTTSQRTTITTTFHHTTKCARTQSCKCYVKPHHCCMVKYPCCQSSYNHTTTAIIIITTTTTCIPTTTTCVKTTQICQQKRPTTTFVTTHICHSKRSTATCASTQICNLKRPCCCRIKFTVAIVTEDSTTTRPTTFTSTRPTTCTYITSTGTTTMTKTVVCHFMHPCYAGKKHFSFGTKPFCELNQREYCSTTNPCCKLSTTESDTTTTTWQTTVTTSQSQSTLTCGHSCQCKCHGQGSTCRRLLYSFKHEHAPMHFKNHNWYKKSAISTQKICPVLKRVKQDKIMNGEVKRKRKRSRPIKNYLLSFPR